MSQLIVVVGARFGYKSGNNVSDVLGNTIAGPTLGAVGNVLVHAVISVELIQSVTELVLARRIDTYGAQDVVPRQVDGIFDGSIAPVNNGPCSTLDAHAIREVAEVGCRHVQQGGTSAVIIIHGQDERIDRLIVHSHDVLVACLDEAWVIDVTRGEILVAQSVHLSFQVDGVFVLYGRNDVEHRAVRDGKVLDHFSSAAILAHDKALHVAGCIDIEIVGIVRQTYGKCVRLRGNGNQHVAVSLLIGAPNDSADRNDVAGDVVRGATFLVANVGATHGCTAQTHRVPAGDNGRVQYTLLLALSG